MRAAACNRFVSLFVIIIFIRMRCALYFGSFNPLHKGHIAIARYVLENCDVDCVRLILSPHNPLKKGDELQDARQRLLALQKSVEKFNRAWRKEKCGTDEEFSKRLEASDIEFHLPKPLYTYNTLKYLREREPETEFVLVIGADNLAIIENWYRGTDLLREFPVWVYPRKGFDTTLLCQKYGVTCLDAPLKDISSTMIREGIASGRNMDEYLY